MKTWYAVHTHPRAENVVVNHLKRQGFDTYLPLFLKQRKHARRIDWVPAPFFPRYLFVGMNIENMCWRVIRSTVGVVNFVCSGDKPIKVPPSILGILKNREDENGLVRLGGKLKTGDQVQIIDGAFGDSIAIVKEMRGLDRVTLLLKLMGRQMEVHTSLERILPID